MNTLLAIALGGAGGALARHGISQWLARPAGELPVATLLVNLVGSFALGALLALSLRADSSLPALFKPALMVGFLGAFTTFSAFSVEMLGLLRAGRPGLALLYIGLSVGLGLAAAALGWALLASD